MKDGVFYYRRDLGFIRLDELLRDEEEKGAIDGDK
jgi:hypothetical protein